MLYDQLVAALWATGWTPHVFDYDWRKGIEHPTVAPALTAWIRDHGSQHNPVHLITHSQGGPVARKALHDLAHDVGCDEAKKIVGKVILLGPANYGAFVAALAVAGSLRQIPVCKLFPRPPAWVQPEFWDRLAPRHIEAERFLRSFLTGTSPWAAGIDTSCFNGQTTVILGSHPFRRTPGGVQFRGRRLVVNHDFDLPGDGWVPDEFAMLEGTKTYRSPGTGHIFLPMARRVIVGILDFLNGDKPSGLEPVDGDS
jgi:pimeloyl-ACP methyl ester carboxylesterase